MKYLVFTTLLLSLFTLYAQNIRQKDKPKNQIVTTYEGYSKVQDRNLAAVGLRNTKIRINNIEFDYRVLKHYDESILRKMSLTKLKQIHYLYTESYTILDLDKCSGLNFLDVDVAVIESERKEDADTIVEYGKDCKVHVRLISRNLVTQKFNEFKN